MANIGPKKHTKPFSCTKVEKSLSQSPKKEEALVTYTIRNIYVKFFSENFCIRQFTKKVYSPYLLFFGNTLPKGSGPVKLRCRKTEYFMRINTDDIN